MKKQKKIELAVSLVVIVGVVVLLGGIVVTGVGGTKRTAPQSVQAPVSQAGDQAQRLDLENFEEANLTHEGSQTDTGADRREDSAVEPSTGGQSVSRAKDIDLPEHLAALRWKDWEPDWNDQRDLIFHREALIYAAYQGNLSFKGYQIERVKCIREPTIAKSTEKREALLALRDREVYVYRYISDPDEGMFGWYPIECHGYDMERGIVLRPTPSTGMVEPATHGVFFFSTKPITRLYPFD